MHAQACKIYLFEMLIMNTNVLLKNTDIKFILLKTLMQFVLDVVWISEWVNFTSLVHIRQV